jgi:hypothetical protein
MVKLQTRSDALANRNFKVKRAHAAGSLPKARTLSKKSLKPVSPTEHDYGSCQWSPSSEISFGWQEVPTHTHTASSCSSDESDGVDTPSTCAGECTNSNEQIKVATEDSKSRESVQGKEERNFGVTATNKEEVVAKSTHLVLKSVVSQNLENSNFRMNKTRDSIESISVGHSEESSYPQNLAGNLAEDSCRKKKTHDVPMREDSGSDNSADSVEVTQANRM